MKHQFFFFISFHSFSAYAMQPEQNKQLEQNSITKNQLISRFSAFNYQMKQLYPDTFDAKEFGWFVTRLREMPIDEFTRNTEDLLDKIKYLNAFEQKELG